MTLSQARDITYCLETFHPLTRGSEVTLDNPLVNGWKLISVILSEWYMHGKGRTERLCLLNTKWKTNQKLQDLCVGYGTFLILTVFDFELHWTFLTLTVTDMKWFWISYNFYFPGCVQGTTLIRPSQKRFLTLDMPKIKSCNIFYGVDCWWFELHRTCPIWSLNVF